MNKKLQVFVSSTYTDLIEERQAAVQAILDAGHIPAGMELFKAGKSQMDTIRKWIDASDIYMLILGGRYGSIEKSSGFSYTELEYRYALSKNMPVFAIVLDDKFLSKKSKYKDKYSVYENDNINKYNNFKNFIKTNIVKFAQNTDQICTIIHAQLNTIINDSDYILIGWIRCDDITSSNSFTVFAEVSERLVTKNFAFPLLPNISKSKFRVPSTTERINNNTNYIVNAKTLFIKCYKYFQNGISKKEKSKLYNNDLDKENILVYDLIVPFFIRAKILEEQVNIDNNISSYIAKITPFGAKLYLYLTSNN